MNETMEGLLSMISAKRRLEIGRIIQRKRKVLGIDQVALANRVWHENISSGALQSRISRIERGESWPDYKLVFDVIEELELWDQVLDPADLQQIAMPTAQDDLITFDQMIPSLEKYIPGLRESLKLLHTYSLHDCADLFYRQLSILCDTAKNFELLNSQNL